MKVEAIHSVKSESNFNSVSKKAMRMNSTFAFSLLVKGIYSDPHQTSIQEYISNARDAHRRVGKDESTIEITLPTEIQPTFEIRDYGCSISPEKMDDLVMEVGASDKRANNQETGGYGLGFKSGFAISDSFLAIVFYKGEQIIYNFHYDEGGDAVGELITRIPTTEADGVKISIPIKQGDVHKVRRAAIRAVTCWKVRPKLNLLPHQYEYSFPDLKPHVLHEDDKLVIYKSIPSNSALSTYVNNTTFVYPVIFDGIPNKSPFDHGEAMSLFQEKEYQSYDSEYTRALSRVVFLKASVDDIAQAPDRESFRTNDSLKNWYMDRIVHLESVLRDIAVQGFKGSSPEDVVESIKSGTENFRSFNREILRRYNEEWIPENKPRFFDGKYELIRVNSLDDRLEFEYLLAHGPVSDYAFPFIYNIKETGRRGRVSTKGPTPHPSNLDLTSPKFYSGMMAPAFKLPTYMTPEGCQELRWLNYDSARWPTVNSAKVSEVRQGATPEENTFAVELHPNGTQEGVDDFVRVAKELCKLSAPSHPHIQHHRVPLTDEEKQAYMAKHFAPDSKLTIKDVPHDRIEEVVTKRPMYTGWLRDVRVVRKAVGQVVCYRPKAAFIIENREEEAKAPRSYSRKLSRCKPHYTSYYTVDEADLTPEVREDLIKYFHATVVMNTALPVPQKRAKSEYVKTSLSRVYFYHNTTAVSREIKQVSHLPKDHKDFLLNALYELGLRAREERKTLNEIGEEVMRMCNVYEPAQVYFMPNTMLDVLKKLEVKPSENSVYAKSSYGDNISLEELEDKVNDELKKALRYLMLLSRETEGKKLFLLGVPEKSFNLVKNALDWYKTEKPEDIRTSIYWLPDVLPEGFKTEDSYVQFLHRIGDELSEKNCLGNITLSRSGYVFSPNHISGPYMKKMEEMLVDRLAIAEGPKNFDMGAFWTHLLNMKEFSVLSVLRAHSVLLYPRVERAKTTESFEGSKYLEAIFGKHSPYETYDWKVCEALVKLILDNNFLLFSYVMEAARSFKHHQEHLYKKFLGKPITLEQVRKALAKIPKDAPRMVDDFDIHIHPVNQARLADVHTEVVKVIDTNAIIKDGEEPQVVLLDEKGNAPDFGDYIPFVSPEVEAEVRKEIQTALHAMFAPKVDLIDLDIFAEPVEMEAEVEEEEE